MLIKSEGAEGGGAAAQWGEALDGAAVSDGGCCSRLCCGGRFGDSAAQWGKALDGAEGERGAGTRLLGANDTAGGCLG